jgi:enoyl-CoA hydratase/carnithine racemase
MISTKNINNILVITFDSPKGNMLSYSDLLVFERILDSKQLDSWAGIILTGSNQSFCTGVNLGDGSTQYNHCFKLLDSILYKLYSYTKPLIVAINGHAVGAGFLFLLCADFVYASNSLKVKYGLPEINVGLGLDDLMFYVIKKKLPYFLYKKMIYSGKLVTHEVLCECMVIDELIEPNHLLNHALSVMDEVIHNNLISFIFCKEVDKAVDLTRMQSFLDDKCYEKYSIIV